MRWKNKGHEVEQYAKELMLNQNTQKKYYIFGAGFLGKSVASVLQFYGCMTLFIDNDVAKQRSKVDGIGVISLEDYLHIKDGQIVVAVSVRNSHVIIKQLENHSLQHEKDFWMYDEFVNYIFPIVSTYCYDKSFVSLAQISLTERCSLKCKKCAHGCSYVENNEANDLILDQVYKSADSFFSKIDFVREFVLIGGEPLLYKELAQVIRYIGERYRNQMGIYCITTNGTIIPKDDILEVCRKYNVLFRISNYSKQIPRVKGIYQCLMSCLDRHNVSYILGNDEFEWFDYGFDYVNRNAEKEELIKVFDLCRTPCREVRENRFYYCVMARSVSDNLKFNIGQDDYLDLDKLNGEGFKKELLEFTLGYSEKGYLDMCNHCNGADAKNYPIPAAEQMEKMDN